MAHTCTGRLFTCVSDEGNIQFYFCVVFYRDDVCIHMYVSTCTCKVNLHVITKTIFPVKVD